MSAGDKAWNAYVDQFGKEPTNSGQLQNYAKGQSDLQNLNYKSARDTFNNNKGKGKIDDMSSKSKPPSAPKSKSKKSKKSKAKKAKKPPKTAATLTAPNMPTMSKVPSASENEADDYEYYYEDEAPHDTNAPVSLPPPVPEEENDDEEYDGNPTGVVPMEPTKKKGLFSGFGKKKTQKSDGESELAITGYRNNDTDTGTETETSPTLKWAPNTTTHDGGEVNYTGDRLNDKESSQWAYFALALSIVALIVSVLGIIIVAGVLHTKVSNREETMTSPALRYDGMEGMNEHSTAEVGDFYGWQYSRGRDIDYQRSDEGRGYQGTDSVQYPLHDIHVNIGDTLVFKRRDSWPEDDLYLVPKEVFDNCNFSYPYNLTNDEGDMDNTSSLWLAGTWDMYCPSPQATGHWTDRYLGSACQYEFPIEDWSEYGEVEEGDLFGELITSDTLYFTSSFYWDQTSEWAQRYKSCKKGLKLAVHISHKKREMMPLIRSSDAWREIQSSAVVQSMHASIGHISRQLILQQFNDEQRVRSEGDSGLTNVRGQYDGDAAYDDGTYTNGAIASIHDHSDNIIVVGIGEIQAVLNGVEFATRHNDYNLNMPSTTDSKYGATEPIPYPDVPSEVENAGSVNAQILEMQEWFRAFKTQNKSHRNYTDYFKPILCYLEGNYIIDTDILDEPFDSDRHAIDARTWKQLHDKIRWMMNSGRKNTLENLAHLPSAVRGLMNDTYPIVSNWEYRILCIPLKHDIPTERFRVVNDLSVQLMGAPQTREELYYSRRSRFELSRYININSPDSDHRWSAGRKRWNYLDYLMEQIPGKDGWNVNLTDILPDKTDACIHYNTDKILNSGYYSRFFGLSGADAMGSSKHRRGWSDRNFFAAQTTHTQVSPVEFNFEEYDIDGFIQYFRTISRWSYAIPLEIIYQTPLSRWNPHRIPEIDRNDNYGSGDCESDPFQGWAVNNAYFTPAGFYEGLTSTSSADTASDNVCAEGSDGSAYPVYASGHWITFPEIGNGIGKVRQRYPIFPIHNSGSAAFKEVKALQDVILSEDYDDPLTNPNGFFGDSRDLIYGFEMNLKGGGHQHVLYVPGWRVRNYWRDSGTGDWLVTSEDTIEAESDTRNGHAHTVTVWRDQDSEGVWVYHVKACRPGSLSDEDNYDTSDWMTDKCVDNHDALERE